MTRRLLKIKTKAMRAAPAGRCIYCSATGVALSEEHAVPLALGGRDVIPSASCETCRRITEKFEHQCLRGFLYDYRSASGFPTRHKGEQRQSIVQLKIDSAGTTERIEVDAGNYPRYLVMPHYPLPGMIVGRDRGAEVMVTTLLLVRQDDAPKMHRTIVNQTLKLHSFLRMIAKIGHALAVARCKPSELATFEMLLPKAILGKDPFLYDLVGSDGAHSKPTPRILHEFHFGTLVRDSTEYLVASIRLFANMGAPRYLAVVGQRVRR